MVGLARIAVSEVYRNISISTGMSSYVAYLIMSDYLIQLR